MIATSSLDELPTIRQQTLPRPPRPAVYPRSLPPPLPRPRQDSDVHVKRQRIERPVDLEGPPAVPPALERATLVIKLPMSGLDDAELAAIVSWLRGRPSEVTMLEPSPAPSPPATATVSTTLKRRVVGVTDLARRVRARFLLAVRRLLVVVLARVPEK
jgi:hypothetical protein